MTNYTTIALLSYLKTLIVLLPSLIAPISYPVSQGTITLLTYVVSSTLMVHGIHSEIEGNLFKNMSVVYMTKTGCYIVPERMYSPCNAKVRWIRTAIICNSVKLMLFIFPDFLRVNKTCCRMVFYNIIALPGHRNLGQES